MPKTLLAVDDSATMRKVLEITFAGEDFRVLAADGAQKALAQLGEEPIAVVIDTSLGSDDGYALAKQVRSRDARAAIVLMASRYNPYDAARGKDAGADDFIDKPFDTQAILDKVKKAIAAREAGKGAPVPAIAPPPAAAPAPAPPLAAAPAPFGGTPRAPAVVPGAVRAPVQPTVRTHTLSFEGNKTPQPAPVAAVSRTAPSAPNVFHPAPPAHAPAPPPPRAPEPARAPAPAPVAGQGPRDNSGMGAAVNGQLAGKLGDLGLTPQQVEGVLALSREVVERVVWEVVPQLAETIIKEEIARLTKD